MRKSNISDEMAEAGEQAGGMDVTCGVLFIFFLVA